MRRQAYRDGIIDIGPFRMMIHPVGLSSDPRHEGERLFEVSEPEVAGNRFLFTVQRPVGQILRQGG